MNNLNFMFKQTRGGSSKTKVDNTLGFPVDAVCKVSSSEEGKNYVYFNNHVTKHFDLAEDGDYATVFGKNPQTGEVTFIVVNADKETLDQYPVTNSNKIQKGNLKNGIVRITSGNAIEALVDVETDENEDKSWDETFFVVDLKENDGEKYMTIGNVLEAPEESEDNSTEEVDADIQQEAEERAEEMPFPMGL